jgi:endonuclease/exonuclease/phosphatase family metal-dependent hydrolase
MKRLLTIGIGLYGLIVNTILVGRWLMGEITVVAVVNLHLALVLLPALALFPLALLMRRVRLALLLVPALWVTANAYLPLFIPRPIPDVNGPHFTIASYNLAARSDQLERLFDNLLALDTDVIGLQEVSQEAAVYIADHLSNAYPYQSVQTRFKPFYGTGILSRYPIVVEHIYAYAPTRLRLQWAQINIDGTPITVFNFHAQPVTESWRPPDVMIRRRQVMFMLDAALAINGPRVLVGDFNLTEQSPEYGQITAHFRDAWVAAGYGMGFTNPYWGDLSNPPISREILALVPRHRRIDYVFYDDHFQATRAAVHPDPGGSDHLPVIAALVLPERGS